MFISLLVVTFAVALGVSLLSAAFFRRPVKLILQRVVGADYAAAWQRYLGFAILVVGVSGGVRVWELEKYITAPYPDQVVPPLTWDRWTLEIYRTIIESLQAIAWVLLVFFVLGLLAFLLIRLAEAIGSRRRDNRGSSELPPVAKAGDVR